MSLSDKILKITSSDLTTLIHNKEFRDHVITDDSGTDTKPFGQQLLTRTVDAPHDSPLGATHHTDTRVHANRQHQLQPGHDAHHYLRVNRFAGSGTNDVHVSIRVGDHNLEKPYYVVIGPESSTTILDVVPIQGQSQYAVFEADGFRVYDAAGVELGDKIKYNYQYIGDIRQLTVVRDGSNIVVFALELVNFKVSVYAKDGTVAYAKDGAGFPFANPDRTCDYVAVGDQHYFTWMDADVSIRRFYKYPLRMSTGALNTPLQLEYIPTSDIQVTKLPFVDGKRRSEFGADGHIYTVNTMHNNNGLSQTITFRRAAFTGVALEYSTQSAAFTIFREITETREPGTAQFTNSYDLAVRNGIVLPERNTKVNKYLMGPDGFDEVPTTYFPVDKDKALVPLVTEHGVMRIADSGNDVKVTRWRFSDEDRAGATHVELFDSGYVEFTNAAGSVIVNGGTKASDSETGSRYSLDNDREVLAMSPNGSLVLDKNGRLFKVPFHTEAVLDEVWDSATEKFKDEAKFDKLVEFVRKTLSPLMVMDVNAGTYVDPRCMCLNPAPSAEKLYTLSEFDKVEQADILKIIECFSSECARVRTSDSKSVVQHYMKKHATGCSSELLQDFIQPEDHTYFWVVIGILLAVIVAYVVWNMM